MQLICIKKPAIKSVSIEAPTAKQFFNPFLEGFVSLRRICNIIVYELFYSLYLGIIR